MIALALCGELHILPGLFQVVMIPPGVYAELARGATLRSPTELPWIVVSRPAEPRKVSEVRALQPRLGGEAEAIALAAQTGALLIIDENRGRRVADLLGIPHIGLLGLLPLAKERGLVSQVAPFRDRLRAVGFYFTDGLWLTTLRRAGEEM